ncbi:MAG: hypothetical protein QOE61_1671 [Micromonosporaceae bacterium]|nr:hypothetical protein [Micromonosporaceae bacterium]
MTHASEKGAAYGRQKRPDRTERRRWLWLALLLVGVAITTISVPPLIAPRPGPSSESAGVANPPLSASSPVPASSPAPGISALQATSGPRPLIPTSVEAEDPANDLVGIADVVACATCGGGARVRYLGSRGQVRIRVTAPTSGTRAITVVYETSGPRTLKISLNGVALLERRITGDGWTNPQTLQFTAALSAGPVVLTFYNDEAPAPDIDRVTIS